MFARLALLITLLSTTLVWGNYTVIPEGAQLQILTPDLTQQKRLKIKLDNGLEAILVSDPKVDLSAAVLVVKAGYWQDPIDYPGVAHFLEHMLFLGTKQYPVEDEYARFISENGGTHNAMTYTDYTAFMFSVLNSAFPQALDRFSSFFKDPLFNPSGVTREMNAVNQEFALMQDNDDARASFVMKLLANESHPYHRFNVGNLETLSNVSQDLLKQWYSKHYSANLMRLMVYSPLPLDQLTALVVQDFSGVTNSQLPEFENSSQIFLKENEGKLLILNPKKNINSLSILWELPSKFADMIESKPDTLLCHILGHEGKESLLNLLKKENLAETLSCGAYRLASQKMMLGIDIGLTPEGVENRDAIIEKVFQMIALLKEKGLPEYIFNEVQKLNKLGYQLQTRGEAFATVMQAATILPYEDVSTFPEYSQVIQRYDPQAFQELIKILVPENGIYILRTNSELPGVKLDQIEPWLKVPFAIQKIPQKTLTTWSSARPNPDINLPPPNPFIPEHAEDVSQQETELNNAFVPTPKAIIDDSMGLVYFAHNTLYGTTEVYMDLEIRTPQILPGNTTSFVLGDIYVKALTENLKDLTYNAALAGLNLDVTRTDFGIRFSIHGYADKSMLFWESVVKNLSEFKVSSERFESYKSSLTRDYQNFAKEKPYLQALEMIRKTLYKDFSTSSQKSTAIGKVTYERFNEFTSKLWQKTFVQGMLYGDLQEPQAKELWSIWKTAVQSSPYPAGKLAHLKVIELSEDKGPYLFEKKVQAQGNSVLLAIEGGSFSMKEYAAEQILGQALSQAFFSELRTKQQTGYIVFVFAEEIEKHLWTFFLEQSNTHDTRDLLARFELFVESYVQALKTEEIPQERFDIIKAALLSILKKPERNSEDMGDLLNKLAFKYDGDFDWESKRIKGYEELTYNEFVTFAQNYLGRKNRRRIAMLINGKIPKELLFQYQRLPNLEPLRKQSVFK